MAEIENKEIHKTEYIDKELPKIYFEKEERKNMTEAVRTVITVSDKTSEKALETFNKIKENLR